MIRQGIIPQHNTTQEQKRKDKQQNMTRQITKHTPRQDKTSQDKTRKVKKGQ